MSFDTSRFSFHPWNDFFGVVMQQGRVQLDSDWNEWVAELGRRLQAGTMDTVGRAVVPRTTPEGFHILAADGALTIGLGRMYVDGLLAENHGKSPLTWDASLAELNDSAPTPYYEQPYLPFNETDQPDSEPTNIFNRPVLSGGPHLVYVDVWQREVTHLQSPDLVEKAIGIDTTGRLQTVWQVKVLPEIGKAGCLTHDSELPAWEAMISPSGARLSSYSPKTMTGDQSPCLAPPSTGYRGLENQLYRVEIHRGGPQASATFKWSRDNATVATSVLKIENNGKQLVIESLGRDDVLGFHAGDWIEVLDDWHELHGLPGCLHRILPGDDGIDAARPSITLETPLPAKLFPVNGQDETISYRHTRIRRWDQAGKVCRADGSIYYDLEVAGTSNGIPVPPNGVKLAMENGILIDFTLENDGEFKAGDHWVFAARTSDGSIEELNQAPPLGIHHHYARLATVTLPNYETDCRVFWPPKVSNESCDCTICVQAEAHNAGIATIQHAIDEVRARGGGTICLDVGVYLLRSPLNMTNVRSLRLRGQGWRTVLQSTMAGGVIDICRGIGVTIENLSIICIFIHDRQFVSGDIENNKLEAMIGIAHSMDIRLCHLTVAAVAEKGATSVAIGLSGIILSISIRDCVLVGQYGIAATVGNRNYLMTADFRLTDNVLFCDTSGVNFNERCLHYGQLRAADNLILGCSQAGVVMQGGMLPAARAIIDGNVLHVLGTGIIAGCDQLRIRGNEIIELTGKIEAPGIHILSGPDKSALKHLHVGGNRLFGQRGHGVLIASRLELVTILDNVIEQTAGGALVMSPEASADYLAVKDNQFINIGVGFNDETQPFFGVLLHSVRRADINGNLLTNVARQALISPLRVGIMAFAVREARMIGNRLHGIGPTEIFKRRAIGIDIAPGFIEVAIEGNTISRVDVDNEQTGAADWSAIVVEGSLGNYAEKRIMAQPGSAVLLTPSNVAYLSATQIALLDIRQASAIVRGNRLRSKDSLAPVVLITGVKGCLFDQNDIRIVNGDAKSELAGHIQGNHVSVANNRLIGSSETAVLELFTDKEKYLVMGNLRTAPIEINGTPDISLPPPWNALNVTIPRE